MKILAVETSCDETAMAVVEAWGGRQAPQFKILADVVSSQIPIHRPFGGVVPTLAKREHLRNLPIVLNKLLKAKSYKLKADLIAVTVGPGLEPALWTGINFAQELGKEMGVKVVGVNHLEGHIYSNWLRPVSKFSIFNAQFSIKDPIEFPKFPAIVLIVSGGHTILLLMKSIGQWQKLGETRDDAVGEAFDKVAKMLGLPYPGGPEVEALARRAPRPRPLSLAGKPQRAGFRSSEDELNFPRPMIHDKSYDFSFSGLKTAVLYYIRDPKDPCPPAAWAAGTGRRANTPELSEKQKAMVCKEFQNAAIDVLVTKTLRAAKEFKAESTLLCGGVAANRALQQEFKSKIKSLNPKPYTLNPQLFVPDKKFNTDNAVMIAAAAYLGKHYPVTKALPNLNL